MRWNELSTAGQLDGLFNRSHEIPVIIFKHSTRCATSSVALARVERDFSKVQSAIEFFLVDVISQRDISSRIAEHLSISHQSPQLLLIRNGNCEYHASHLFISVQSALEKIDGSA